MRRFTAAMLCGLGICASTAAGAFAADVAADTICPAAVPKLVAFSNAGRSNDPKEIENAAHAAADTYLGCFNHQKFAGLANPALQQEWMNYDETKIGQFLVIAGRMQLAQGKPADAAATFKQARTYALDVLEWAPMSQTVHGSNTAQGNSAERNSDRAHSRWYDVAAAVRDAANEELAKLGGGASPMPTAKP